MAWQSDQDARCAGCRQPLDESTDDEAFEDYDSHVVVCHACAERDRAHKKATGSGDGVYIAVTRRRDLT